MPPLLLSFLILVSIFNLSPSPSIIPGSSRILSISSTPFTPNTLSIPSTFRSSSSSAPSTLNPDLPLTLTSNSPLTLALRLLLTLILALSLLIGQTFFLILILLYSLTATLPFSCSSFWNLKLRWISSCRRVVLIIGSTFPSNFDWFLNRLPRD